MMSYYGEPLTTIYCVMCMYRDYDLPLWKPLTISQYYNG